MKNATSMTHVKTALMLGLLIAGGSAGLAKQPRLDRFGDPLPQGALVRLGTVRFRRAAGATAAFSADGKSLLSCGADRIIRTWDAASGRLLQEQRLPSGSFSVVTVLSPSGRLLAFEDKLGSLALWDVSRHRLRHKPVVKSVWPRVAFSSDEKILAIGTDDGAVRVWDTGTGKSRLLGKHKGMVFTLEFSDDGSLMSLGDDRSVRIWDVENGRERSRFTVPKEVVGAAFSPDRKTVATWTLRNAALKRELQFWDAASGEQKKNWKAPDVRGIHALRFLPDSKTILIGAGEQRDVRLWDAAAGKLLRTLPGRSDFRFVLSADGKTAASLGGVLGRSIYMGPMIHVWDLTAGARRWANHPQHGHLGAVDGMAFAPDGRTLASLCKADSTVYLWDIATGRLLHSLTMRKDELLSCTLDFTPDSKYLLIATSSALFRWEVATGRQVGRHSLFDRGDKPHSLRLTQRSEDGQTLVAIEENLSGKKSSYDLFAWDLTTHKRLHSIPLAVEVKWGSHFPPMPDSWDASHRMDDSWRYRTVVFLIPPRRPNCSTFRSKAKPWAPRSPFRPIALCWP